MTETLSGNGLFQGFFPMPVFSKSRPGKAMTVLKIFEHPVLICHFLYQYLSLSAHHFSKRPGSVHKFFKICFAVVGIAVQKPCKGSRHIFRREQPPAHLAHIAALKPGCKFSHVGEFFQEPHLECLLIDLFMVNTLGVTNIA